jgi:hypothetical protein
MSVLWAEWVQPIVIGLAVAVLYDWLRKPKSAAWIDVPLVALTLTGIVLAALGIGFSRDQWFMGIILQIPIVLVYFGALLSGSARLKTFAFIAPTIATAAMLIAADNSGVIFEWRGAAGALLMAITLFSPIVFIWAATANKRERDPVNK